MLAVLFFEWYGGHRDLYSFPARRSSDVTVLPTPALAVPKWPLVPEQPTLPTSPAMTPAVASATSSQQPGLIAASGLSLTLKSSVIKAGGLRLEMLGGCCPAPALNRVLLL